MHHTLERLEGRQLFAGGTVDHHFGNAGTATLTFKTDANDKVSPKQLLVDSSGNLYSVVTTNNTLQIERTDSHGDLDHHFGSHGNLKLAYDPTQGEKVVLDHSDRLVVLVNNTLSRFDNSGRADTAFAGTGSLKLNDFTTSVDLAVDTGDKPYVSGSIAVGSTHVAKQFRVERFITRGKVDRTFQNNGSYDLPFTTTRPLTGTRHATSTGQELRALVDGSVVAVGTVRYGTGKDRSKYTDEYVVGARFLTGGGVDGISYQDTDPAGASVTPAGILSDGSVVVYDTVRNPTTGETVATNRVSGVGIVQLLPDSTLASDHNQFFALPDGREVAVIGIEYVDIVDADGQADMTFNSGKPFTSSHTYGLTAATLPDGRFDVLSTGTVAGQVALRRYSSTA